MNAGLGQFSEHIFWTWSGLHHRDRKLSDGTEAIQLSKQTSTLSQVFLEAMRPYLNYILTTTIQGGAEIIIIIRALQSRGVAFKYIPTWSTRETFAAGHW